MPATNESLIMKDILEHSMATLTLLQNEKKINKCKQHTRFNLI